jgi:hypothetical protein
MQPTYTFISVSATSTSRPSSIITVITVEPTVSFPTYYLIYIGVPVAIVMLLSLCYLNHLYSKYIKIKKLLHLERSKPTIQNNPATSIMSKILPTV